MNAATMLLLDGLLAMCTTVVIRHVAETNVISMLSLGHNLSVPRLSMFCLDFLVQHFTQVLGEPVQYGVQPAGTPLINESPVGEVQHEAIVVHAPALEELEQW